MVDPYSIILMPWITEKTLEARRVADFDGSYKENNNRIEFIVRREATKPQIREAVEQLLDVKVAKVNTKIMRCHLRWLWLLGSMSLHIDYRQEAGRQH